MSSVLFDRKRPNLNHIRVRVASMIAGVCFTIYCYTMPGILGRVATAGELLASQISQLSGVFIGGMMLASVLVATVVRRFDWKRLLLLSSLLTAAAFITPVFVPGFNALLASHGVAGLFAGAGYGVVLACLGDTDNPARSYSLALLFQAVAALMVGYLLTGAVVVETDTNRDLFTLAGFALLAILMSRAIPSKGAKLTSLKEQAIVSTGSYAAVGLIVMLLLFAGEAVLWSSLDAHGVNPNPTASFAGSTLAAALASGALGAFMAAVIGVRLGFIIPVVAAAVVALGSLALLHYSPGSPGEMNLTIAICLNGWAWSFGAAYCMGAVAKLDGKGKLTPIIAAAQLAGLAGGVAVSGMAVLGEGLANRYLLTGGLWLLALVLFVWVARNIRPAGAVANDG